jgi:hypothetical protein
MRLKRAHQKIVSVRLRLLTVAEKVAKSEAASGNTAASGT